MAVGEAVVSALSPLLVENRLAGISFLKEKHLGFFNII